MLPFVQNPLGVFPYRRLQYISSTGTQYIDTGVKPDFAGGDSIEIQYYGEPMQQGQALVGFGSRDVTGGTVTNAVYQGGSSIIFGDSEGYTGVPFDYRHQHLLSISDTEVVDNGSVYAATPKRVTCDYSIYLFTLNNRGSALTSVNYSGMRFYDWKYYHNGVLAQHLIPVLDKSGVPCLYDSVSRTLFYNKGSGTFNYA